ncbi:MAG: hypothetical protein G3M70_11175 [Candidatus Nitronauta litoralis]|uniref:Uncharacterized protein n=1 Tax=Candidatus Nitronauta litoralis TaxID=2705533 RepID=A0A7T0G0K6_9BACT|nr:MAG: hypothetical protein G3M70_11175 [Candidatus Nitronauta litoralis]
MGDNWKPGNLNNDKTDYSEFVNSMASTIEQELNSLMVMDGIDGLSMDSNDESIRDRRRLFVAIARGVVRHLKENKDAIKIALPEAIELPKNITPNDIQTTGL